MKTLADETTHEIQILYIKNDCVELSKNDLYIFFFNRDNRLFIWVGKQKNLQQEPPQEIHVRVTEVINSR